MLILRRVVFVGWMTMVLGMSFLCLSSYFAYSTYGIDFELPTENGVEFSYNRLRWDDGSTWIGRAIRTVGRLDREPDYLDPGGALLKASKRPVRRSSWNSLGFWRVDGPADDPYVAVNYPGATFSRWWACPSWLILAILWFRPAWWAIRRWSGRARRGTVPSSGVVDTGPS